EPAALGGAPRRRVKTVAFPLQAAEAKFVKRATHHEVSDFSSGARALQVWGVIEVSNLDDTVRAIDTHEGSKAHGLPRSPIYDGMKHRVVARRERANPGFTGRGVGRTVVGHVGPLAWMRRRAEAVP